MCFCWDETAGGPGGGGLLLLEQMKALHPDTAVIVMTAFAFGCLGG